MRARISATAPYSSGGISNPISTEIRALTSSGSVWIGIPHSAAASIIFCAISPLPEAITLGAASLSGSYFKATAFLPWLFFSFSAMTPFF